MPALKAALLFIGILMIFVGLVWLAQALDVIPSISTPRIMNSWLWSDFGVVLAVAGVAVVIASRRIGRRRS